MLTSRFSGAGGRHEGWDKAAALIQAGREISGRRKKIRRREQETAHRAQARQQKEANWNEGKTTRTAAIGTKKSCNVR
jgi:hypothetical protein